ncbi:MAG: outer membrane beta-barrel protein [Bryobacteraceae bacterium]|nr:outer membrane beta-barrel protein [Bryobacteraceae bacterium]
MRMMAQAAVAAFLLLEGALGQQAAGERERALMEKIAALEERLSRLEGRMGTAPAGQTLAPSAAASAPPAPLEPNTWLKDTTLNFYFDGYHAWNTHRPLGRVNLLRAYDVTANNFSINQTGMIIDRAADPGAGRRWGFRLDLMYGQATETLQGGAQNEPRPQAYRNVFQAYGSYVAPLGKGLTVDFGKWSSALGPEGNYTKDQINYSRSYFFNFLPFYHMGFRAVYPVNDQLSMGYWLVNGANQTEDFNGFKSQLGQAVIKPVKNVTWTLNYYAGREQRGLVPALHPGMPTIPTQPGLSTTPVGRTPRGRFHVLDTYAFWNATDKLTVGAEFDYVINRVETNGPPQRIIGGAGYLRYQLTPHVYFGQRYVRLNDRAGLFSGVSQNLNDVTSTLGFRPAQGFETRLEYRRDFSNVPFFYRREPGDLSKHQQTFTLGLLYWFGGKAGGW